MLSAFDYISDLHIDHHVKTPNQVCDYLSEFLTPQSTLLILAGDISNNNRYSIEVLNYLKTIYEDILVVLGNHDYYSPTPHSLDRVQELKHLYQDDTIVHILNREIIDIDGVTFAGWTNWYNPYNPYTRHQFATINDSNYIFNDDMSPTDLIYHMSMLDRTFERMIRDIPVDIYITHIPPLHFSTSPYPYHPCFTNEPSSSLKPPACLWVCGHQHLITQDALGATPIITNAMGYPGENHPRLLTYSLKD